MHKLSLRTLVNKILYVSFSSQRHLLAQSKTANFGGWGTFPTVSPLTEELIFAEPIAF